MCGRKERIPPEEWKKQGKMINRRVGKTIFTTFKVNCDVDTFMHSRQ